MRIAANIDQELESKYHYSSIARRAESLVGKPLPMSDYHYYCLCDACRPEDWEDLPDIEKMLPKPKVKRKARKKRSG